MYHVCAKNIYLPLHIYGTVLIIILNLMSFGKLWWLWTAVLKWGHIWE